MRDARAVSAPLSGRPCGAYLPMLRPGLLTAGLLVLVDVMKEMLATLLLRPFGWDTLAVRIFELTSEGEWGARRPAGNRLGGRRVGAGGVAGEKVGR